MSLKRIERAPVRESAAGSAGLYPVQSASFRQPSPFWQAVDMDAVTGVINNAASGASRVAQVVEKINKEADHAAIGQMQLAMKAAWDEGLDDFRQQPVNDQLYDSIESRVKTFKSKMSSQLDSLPLSRGGKEQMSKDLDLSAQQVKFGYESEFRRKKIEFANKTAIQFLEQDREAGNVEGVKKRFAKVESLGIVPPYTLDAAVSAAASKAMLVQADQMPFNQLRSFIDQNQAKLSESGDNTIKIGENSVLRDDLRSVIEKAKARERGLMSDIADHYDQAYVNGDLTHEGLDSDFDYGLIPEKIYAPQKANLQHDSFVLLGADIQRYGGDAGFRSEVTRSIEDARKGKRITEAQATQLRAAVKSGDVAEINRQEEERKRSAEVATANYKLKQLDFEWSADAATRKQQYLDEKSQLDFDTKLTVPQKAQLRERLKKDYESAGNSSDYRKTFPYAQGKRKLDGMKGDFAARGKGYGFLKTITGRGLVWDTNPDEETAPDNFAMAKIQFDDFMRANPQASPADVETYLGKLKTDINRTECDKLMDFWSSYKVPSTGRMSDVANGGKPAIGMTGVFNGKKVVFTEKGWQYAK